MSQQRCATCAHWQKIGDENYRLADLLPRDEYYEPITDAPDGYELRFCRSPLVRFYERPQNGGAALVDGSEYYGRLITTPEFGCVNWEARP